MSRDPLYPTPPPRYERPQGAFQCGDAAHGNPCPLGPLGHGICSRERDCQPVEREGRWFCTRSAAAGGPCAEGPSPTGGCGQPPRDCVPQPTVRKQRGWFVAAVFAATLGMLLIGAAREPKRWLAPGPLTSNHARLLNQNARGARCEACHPAGSDDVSRWFTSLVSSRSTPQVTQTDLCLQCHANLAPSPRTAHGLTADALRANQTLLASTSSDNVSRTTPSTEAETQWACSVCHQEHHGTHHELTELSNHQCATCHQEPFHDFVHGHPEFRDWPSTSGASLRFSHSAHQSKYYAEAKRDYACRDCHAVDSLDRTTSVSYDHCASCHDSKIQAAGDTGIAILSLPMFDLTALKPHLQPDDSWPTDAQGSFDGTLPPWMYLLLLADADVASLLEQQGPSFDLVDLDPSSTTDMQEAARLMRAIRRLCDELANDTRGCVARRLASVTNAPLTALEIDAFFSGLPQAFVRETIQNWFAPANPQAKASSATLMSHTTDRPVIQRTQATDDDLLTDTTDVSDEEAATLSQVDDASEKSSAAGDSDDDLLLEDTSGTQNSERGDEGNQTVRAGSSTERPATTDPPASSASTGWKRSEFGQQLLYAPRGHADPFVTVWIDRMTRSDYRSPDTSAPRDDLRKTVLELPMVQNCMSCHLHRSDGAIQWKTPTTTPVKQLTRFSHRPHLVQPELQDCQHCHAPSSGDDASSQASTAMTGVITATSDFQPIVKASCTSCHRPQGASDRCLECHNYHVHEARDAARHRIP